MVMYLGNPKEIRIRRQGIIDFYDEQEDETAISAYAIRN